MPDSRASTESEAPKTQITIRTEEWLWRAFRAASAMQGMSGSAALAALMERVVRGEIELDDGGEA